MVCVSVSRRAADPLTWMQVILEDLEAQGAWKVYRSGNESQLPPVGAAATAVTAVPFRLTVCMPVFLPGLSTTAESFYKQALFLAARNYHVIVVSTCPWHGRVAAPPHTPSTTAAMGSYMDMRRVGRRLRAAVG